MTDSLGTTLPPVRRCRCGASYRGWRDTGCRECRQSPGAADLAGGLREARRQERVDSLEERAPVPYNEFPPGY